jgi:sulfoxide reductase catalytic subunit YedY
MAHVILPPSWRIPERQVTPEAAYWNRRAFLRAAGLAGASALLGGGGCRAAGEPGTVPGTVLDFPEEAARLFPARRNERYRPERPLTPEAAAATYNNFYEFSTEKGGPARLVEPFRTVPWTLQVSGLVEKPGTYDVYDLMRTLPMEERIYRFRCVEAWAMTVPWTGFPMKAFLDLVKPTSQARYLRLVTFHRPDEAIGIRTQPWYPWPYHEGLRMDEARNELTLLVTGIYGHPLPKQHGAPLRLIVPWKYGYKSIKSIARIDLVADQPPTFWNTVAPDEYGFLSNVDPEVPHPRWSQARERLLPDMVEVPTLPYNGYAEQVAHLYR